MYFIAYETMLLNAASKLKNIASDTSKKIKFDGRSSLYDLFEHLLGTIVIPYIMQYSITDKPQE